MTTLAGTGKNTRAATSGQDDTERLPFLLLGLDLPPAPLFKDVLEKNIIPQVGGRLCGCEALGRGLQQHGEVLTSEGNH